VTGQNLKVDFPYLVEDKDRFGNVRRYVRVKGRKKIRIRSVPGTEQFIADYREAVSGAANKLSPQDLAPRGSFRALCVKYLDSAPYKRLDQSTRGWQKRSLEAICGKHGQNPVARMESRHVRKIRNEYEDKPGTANNILKSLRALFLWANENDQANNNPTLGVKNLKYVKRPHHTITESEMEQYEARHPIGTKPRLAFDLLRYTTGRREDVPRLGPGHLKGGRIRFRQAKNEHRAPVDIDIPAHPALVASIEALPSGHMTFLVTAFGKPYTTAGFGNAMRDWFDQANLPHCSAHSVRKGTPTLMAENEATPHQIMAVTGHQTLAQVEVYTKKAARSKLADAGMAKLKR
jgi:integrase/recombinase XerD